MKTLACKVMVLLGLSTQAWADAPKVAADIAPVHALVARVMAGVGEPDLIIPANSSPHGYAMRPSEAAALSEAEVVVWVGESLTPWFGRALSNMAPEARAVELAEIENVRLLEYRGGATFAEHDHGDHGHGDDHAHDDDHKHAHGYEHGHDDHAHGDEHAHSDEHGHGDKDHPQGDEHGHDDMPMTSMTRRTTTRIMVTTMANTTRISGSIR